MLTRMADSIESAPLDSATMSRYCPPSTSVRMSDQTRWTRRRASSGRSAVATMSSAQTRDRSPSRIAAEVPNCSGEPRQPRLRCSSAKCMCTVGMPRRVPESSMTSSCTRAQACSSSRPANSRSTSSTDTVGTGIVGDRAPAPVGERGAQPLAAAQHEVLQRGDQAVVVVADVGGGGTAVAEITPQLEVTAAASSTADGAAASTLSAAPLSARSGQSIQRRA